MCVCRKVDEFQNYSDMDSMLQYCKDVQTVQRRMAEIQEQVNQINKASYLYGSFRKLHANLTCNNLISVYMHRVCLIVCIFVLHTQIKHTHLIDI